MQESFKEIKDYAEDDHIVDELVRGIRPFHKRKGLDGEVECFVYSIEYGAKSITLTYDDKSHGGKTFVYKFADDSKRLPNETTVLYKAVQRIMEMHAVEKGEPANYTFVTANDKLRPWAREKGSRVFNWVQTYENISINPKEEEPRRMVQTFNAMILPILNCNKTVEEILKNKSEIIKCGDSLKVLMAYGSKVIEVMWKEDEREFSTYIGGSENDDEKLLNETTLLYLAAKRFMREFVEANNLAMKYKLATDVESMLEWAAKRGNEIFGWSNSTDSYTWTEGTKFFVGTEFETTLYPLSAPRLKKVQT